MDEIVPFLPLFAGFIPFFVLLGLYLELIFRYIRGWMNLQEAEYPDHHSGSTVTVLVPFKNEENHLPALTDRLKQQSYPPELLEYLFVDDHSTDRSAEIISSLNREDPRFMLVKNPGRGKKQALKKGLEAAKGTWILQTDADTLPGKRWIETMVRSAGGNSPLLVAGPVVMSIEEGWFDKMQALEYLSLSGATLGAYGAGSPTLCSAANLMYRASWIRRQNDPFREEIPGGDDVFLLHRVKKNHPDSILFINNPKALVTIQPQKSLKTFFRQRTRWSGKSIFFTDLQTWKQQLTVFFMNLSITVTLIAGFFNPFWFGGAAIAYLIKSIPDFLLIRLVAEKYQQTRLLRYFIPLQLIYPLYVSLSVIQGLILIIGYKLRSSGTRSWK